MAGFFSRTEAVWLFNQIVWKKSESGTLDPKEPAAGKRGKPPGGRRAVRSAGTQF
jgi:hypothetical protein